MLGIVDGIGGIRRCRPAEPGCRCRLGPSRKLGKVGKPALGGPHGFQGVEGRHARPGLIEIEARIGEADPALGRAGRKRKRKALTFKPALVRRKVARHLLAHGIEQDRLLDDLAREHLLGKAWHEHRVEAEPSCGFDRPHEDASIPLRRRRHGCLQEETSENDQNLAQRRPDRREP